MQGEFSVADSFRRLRPERAACEERTDLIQEPCLHHVNDSRIDGPRIGSAVGQQSDATPTIGKHMWRRVPLPLMLRERATRERMHFKRADQAPRIVPVNARSGSGIDLLQLRMKRIRSKCLQASAEFGIRRRTLEQSRQECLHIEVGAANNDGGSPVCSECGEQVAGSVQPVLDGEPRGMRIRDVDEMVRDLCAQRAGGFRRADVHAAVDLHGVGSEDLGARDTARGGHRQRALAARRWSDNEDDPCGIHAEWLYPLLDGTLQD